MAKTEEIMRQPQSDTEPKAQVAEVSEASLHADLNIVKDGAQVVVRVYPGKKEDRVGQSAAPAASLFDSTEGNKSLLIKLDPNSCRLRLDWQDGQLVGIRVDGAFPPQHDSASISCRRVYKSRQARNVLILQHEPDLLPARVKFSESGVPSLLEVDRSDLVDSNDPSSANMAVRLEWDKGVLTGVRIQGDLGDEVSSEKNPSQQLFRVRHRKNEVSLAAAPLDGKELEGLHDSVRTIERTLHKLDTSLHRDFLEVANGVVGAVWHAQRRPERVNAALPLVLISQVHRSGGTLLARLFDGHPEVLVFPQEPRWNSDAKFRWPEIDPTEGPLRIARRLLARNFEDLMSYNLFGYDKQTVLATHDQRLPFQWSQWAYVEAFLEAWEAKRPNTTRECLDIYMTAYFSAFIDWRGRHQPKKFITAFTTRMNFIRSHPGNEAFFDDYPDGLMISICRHPADWYASATNFRKGPEDMALWRESAECALELKNKHPSQLILVTFEELIADPSKAMRCIAKRIGLTWDPALTIPTFNGMRVGSNSSFHAAVGIDASVVGRRGTLPMQIREKIETENLPLYQQFVEAADV